MSSLITYIYLIQSITIAFSQAMINNALFLYPNKDKNFTKTLSVGLIYLLIVVAILCILLFFLQEQLINMVKIAEESKGFALDYLVYMIPFLMVYAVSQYYMYIIYALNAAFYNILYMFLIIVFNYGLNLLFYHLGWGVKGIAFANGLAVLIVLPLYMLFCFKYKISLTFLKLKGYYSKAYRGVKRLGFASILEPASHNFIQFIMAIIVVQMGAEMLSAKHHAQNFLLLATTLSLAFGVILQLNTATMYGHRQYDGMHLLYKRVLKYAITMSLLLSLVTFMVVKINLDNISNNELVKHYIILAMLVGFVMEPIRVLSILSKAYLKGLQIANLPITFSIISKVLVSVPLYYVVLNYTNFGLVGILGVEIIGYSLNFIIFQTIIYFALKKRNL